MLSSDVARACMLLLFHELKVSEAPARDFRSLSVKLIDSWRGRFHGLFAFPLTASIGPFLWLRK